MVSTELAVIVLVLFLGVNGGDGDVPGQEKSAYQL